MTARPNRIYKTKSGKYYYLINGKKKFIKIDKNISQNQLVKINIKNIIGDTFKKLKVKKKRTRVKYTKKIIPEMEKSTGILPSFNFKYQPRVLTIREIEGVPEDGYQPAKVIPRVQPTSLQQIQNTPPTSLTDEFIKTQKILLDNLVKKDELIMKGIKDIEKRKLKIEDITDIEDEKFRKTFKEIVRTRVPAVSGPSDSGYYSEPKTDIEIPRLLKTKENVERQLMAKEDVDVKGEVFAPKKEIPLRPLKGVEMDQGTHKLAEKSRDKLFDKFSRVKVEQSKENFLKWIGENKDKKLGLSYKIGSYNLEDRNFKKALRDKFGDSLGMGARGSDVAPEGLYNSEIETILKKNVKDVVPVIASNELNFLDKFVKPNMKRFGFILNTASTNLKGGSIPSGHWQSVFINNEDDYPSVEFYDPLVSKPKPSLIKKLKEIAKKINPESMFLLKTNNLKRQADNTSTCGYHSVGFIEDRMNGFPWSHVTGYDNYMERMKPKDEADGETDIKKKIKKYNKYI